MTVIAAWVDPDPQTSAAFARTLEEYLQQHFGPAPQGATLGNLGCRWWACGSAPISMSHHGPTTVWVLGNLDNAGQPTQSAAERLADHFHRRGPDGLACHGGYFLAIIHQKDHHYVFTDRLGLFPCYYAARDGRLTLGTSSDIPVLHPKMPRNLNRKGLVGHLLCMHEILGEPLWQECHRLRAGEILHFAESRVETTTEQSIPVSDACFGLPFATLVEKSHTAMQAALRQYKGGTLSLLFSGGLDSRLLAGYMKQSNANVNSVYTLGSTSDNEFRCAARVCHKLGWPHRRIDIDFSRYPRFASRQILTEQVANGFSDLSWWSLEDVPDAKPPLATGMVGDAILGGSHILWAYDPAAQTYSFDTLFRRINAWGLPPDLICRLLPDSDTPGLIAENIQQLRDFYESLPGRDFQKAWQFDLLHRQRFHTASTLRRLSHIVWPTAPLAHEVLLTLAGSMPACAFVGRRLQEELLIRKFPRLAAIPIDANTLHPRPLVPSLGWRVKNKIAHTAGIRRLRIGKQESRWYYRVFDINNKGWYLLRDAFHEALLALSGILDLDCVRTLVPERRTSIQVRDSIIDASGIKSLIAFVLWYRRHSGLCSSRPAV